MTVVVEHIAPQNISHVFFRTLLIFCSLVESCDLCHVGKTLSIWRLWFGEIIFSIELRSISFSAISAPRWQRRVPPRSFIGPERLGSSFPVISSHIVNDLVMTLHRLLGSKTFGFWG
ncbi:unnamed protein product [Periconia digitata]|uniref:Uncharacterized protein n=1 Tax=Periconia digitata TaxID=1303443 RepID=A0A9W4U4A6_9PLEO|nr:unnamed protein product [Periconia digitata]